jgi:hypothetical protein
MIVVSPDVRIYLACGVTDMRKGMVGLAMLVQQTLSEDAVGGAIYAFRGRRAGLIKLIWHDGVGLCMLTKQLDAEGRADRQGRLADYLTRLDFVILDELGYLPFAQKRRRLIVRPTLGRRSVM